MDLEYLRLALLFLHLLGMALLVGGTFTQIFIKQFRISTAMVAGVLTQLATGILLSAPLGRDEDLNHTKIAVKALLAVLLAVMVLVPRKREKVNPGHFYGIATLSVITVAVAVFWT